VKVIDLTQAMANGMPVMEGIMPPEFRDLADVATDGYAMSRYTFINHTGTHVDAPAHQIADGASLAELPARCRIVVAPLKVRGANGGPARVLAFVDE
jgi:arylformamidase